MGGKPFQSKEGADELEERGQGGGRLLETKKSEEWPLAIELWHLATVARVYEQADERFYQKTWSWRSTITATVSHMHLYSQSLPIDSLQWRKQP